jgi:hypothetical protein
MPENKPKPDILKAILADALDIYRAIHTDTIRYDREFSEEWEKKFGVSVEAGLMLINGLIEQHHEDGRPQGPSLLDGLVDQICDRVEEAMMARTDMRLVSVSDVGFWPRSSSPPPPNWPLPVPPPGPPPEMTAGPESTVDEVVEEFAPAIQLEPVKIELLAEAIMAQAPPKGERSVPRGSPRSFSSLAKEILRDKGTPMSVQEVDAIVRTKYKRTPAPATIGVELCAMARKDPSIVRVREGTFVYVYQPPEPMPHVPTVECNHCQEQVPTAQLSQHKREQHPVTDNPNGRREEQSAGLGGTLGRINF